MSTIRGSTFELYLGKVMEVELLSIEEEKELFKKAKDGDAQAREQCIKANLRMVVSIARSYEHCGLPLLDLVSEGSIGLMKAVDKFDQDFDNRFYTYAQYWIHHYIKRALDKQLRIIRLPSQMFQEISKINKASEKLQGELGREPLPEEIAFEVSMSEKKVLRLMKVSTTTISLDSCISDSDNSNTLMEFVSDPSIENPSTRTEQDDLISLISRVFVRLTKREQAVLKIRYGLNGEGPKTLEEIGRDFKITSQRISQIQNNALRKLKKMIDSKYLRRMVVE